jgi:hypothetical protein
MLSIRPLRRSARSSDTQPLSPLGFQPSSRRDVCPPALAPEAPDTTGLRRWLRRLGAPQASSADPLERVLAVREEFARALDGIGSQHAQFLQHRIRHQRSLRELWHLRAEMFVLIAQALTEHEAEQRMAPLARHFAARAAF